MQGKPKISEKTSPSATFVHHKIPRAHPGLNPGRRGRKPVTNRLSYGAAAVKALGVNQIFILSSFFFFTLVNLNFFITVIPFFFFMCHIEWKVIMLLAENILY
jgi:hypothetical protein